MPPRPPAKRQRKIVISDDEAEPPSKNQKPKPKTRPKPALQPGTPKKSKLNATPKPSPKSSPEKSRNAKGKEEKPNKSLHSFFGKATEEQRWARRTSSTDAVEDIGIVDPIEDDFSDEPQARGVGLRQGSTLDRRKVIGEGVPSFRLNGHSGLTSSQKFARRAEPSPQGATRASPITGLGKPWAEQFSPVSLDELAIHKKKVKDVQDWLSAAFEGCHRQV